MKIAIITVAGISSRFNEGINEEYMQLKSIYYEGKRRDTLLMHLVMHCSFADKIIIVGGYKYDDLEIYMTQELPYDLKSKVVLMYNPHYRDFASGYSFYMGLKRAFKEDDLEEILFVEGDLAIDSDSFRRVAESKRTVLTYNHEPIDAKKAVVLYRNNRGKYNYAFDSSHGLLTIEEPFSCIFNSGQLWKFIDINALKGAAENFFNTELEGTNLKIIQEYLNRISEENIELIGLKKWVNCNTRKDFHKIAAFWEERV